MITKLYLRNQAHESSIIKLQLLYDDGLATTVIGGGRQLQ